MGLPCTLIFAISKYYFNMKICSLWIILTCYVQSTSQLMEGRVSFLFFVLIPSPFFNRHIFLFFRLHFVDKRLQEIKTSPVGFAFVRLTGDLEWVKPVKVDLKPTLHFLAPFRLLCAENGLGPEFISYHAPTTVHWLQETKTTFKARFNGVSNDTLMLLLFSPVVTSLGQCLQKFKPQIHINSIIMTHSL